MALTNRTDHDTARDDTARDDTAREYVFRAPPERHSTRRTAKHPLSIPEKILANGVLTVSETGAFLGISDRKIDHMIQDGTLEIVRHGPRTVRVTVASILAFCRGEKMPKAAPEYDGEDDQAAA